MKLTEGLDYEFVETGREYHSTRLLTSDWAGTVFSYGEVSIKEDPENDRAILKFAFNIEQATDEYTKDFLDSSMEFKSHLGNLLSQIIAAENIHIGAKA